MHLHAGQIFKPQSLGQGGGPFHCSFLVEVLSAARSATQTSTSIHSIFTSLCEALSHLEPLNRKTSCNLQFACLLLIFFLMLIPRWWIRRVRISKGLPKSFSRILNKTNQRTRVQSLKNFCETSYFNCLVHSFPCCRTSVDCGVWNEVECRVWSVKSRLETVECWKECSA